MLTSKLDKLINSYQDFLSKGILFRDLMPVLSSLEVFTELIEEISLQSQCKKADAIIAIDSQEFLFAAPISIKSSKPLVVARKPGKLPGNLTEKIYSFEYGNNSLSIQKESLEIGDTYVIIDD